MGKCQRGFFFFFFWRGGGKKGSLVVCACITLVHKFVSFDAEFALSSDTGDKRHY